MSEHSSEVAAHWKARAVFRQPLPRTFQPLAALEPSYRARFIRGSIHVQNVNAPDIPYEEDPTFIPLTKFHKRYRVPELTFVLKYLDEANTLAEFRQAFVSACVLWFHAALWQDLGNPLNQQIEPLSACIIDSAALHPDVLVAHPEVKRQLSISARQCSMAIKAHPSGSHT